MKFKNGFPVAVQPERRQPKRKLRYLILMPCLRSGGAERTMLSVAQYTVSCECCGFVVWDLHYDEIFHEAERIAPVRLCDGHAAAQGALNEMVASERADLVFAWGASQLSTIHAPPGVPFVDISQGEIVMGKAANPAPTHYVGVSEAARAAFPPSVQQQAVVIENGIDPRRIAKRAERRDIRQQLGINQSARVVLYASRWSPEKRPETLPYIFRHLPDGYVLLLTGHDNPQCPMRDEIIAKLRSEFGSRIVWVEPKSNLADLFTAADVMVLPSRSEGLPLIVLESFYRGVAVVTCEYAALKSIQRFGDVCGHVPVKFDPEEFADEIQRVIEDRAMIALAKMTCEEHWLASTMAYRYECLFRQAVMETIEKP